MPETQSICVSLSHPGNRMLATGIYDRSCGNLDAMVSLGHDIRQYMPFGREAFGLAGHCLEY